MKERLNNILSLLNNALGLFLAISCSIVFFVLIFKPFPLDHINFDSKILYIIGLGIIVFFAMVIVRIVYPGLVYNIPYNQKRPILSSYNRGFIIWVLSSSLFCIYLMYPGLVNLTSFLVFKVTLICLVPPLLLIFHDKNEALQLKNEALAIDKKIYQKQVKEYNDEHKNISIDFCSLNNTEKISLLLTEVVLINSADNYVEIHYREDDKFKMKLLRNTLKNIESQIKIHHIFIRCHRKYIVNSNYIEELNGNCNNHQLFLKEYNEPIPVSRQYFYTIKNALQAICG